MNSSLAKTHIFCFAFLIPALFYPLTVRAEAVTSLFGQHSYGELPRAALFLDQKVKVFNILQALLYEEKRYYQKANTIWETLPFESVSIQNHLFQTEFISFSSDQLPPYPLNEKSIRLISGYLAWQKKWEEAVQVLESYDSPDQFEFKNKVERIRLYLYLGDYRTFLALLEHLSPENRNDKMIKSLLKIWYHALQEQYSELNGELEMIEEDYLYLSLISALPRRSKIETAELRQMYERCLLRFPSDDNLLERLAELHFNERNWDELSQLVKSQNMIDDPDYDWCFLAVLYLETGETHKLQELLKSPDIPAGQPAYYDLLAQRAIRQERWDVLEVIVDIYYSRFPEVLDGKFYKVVLYEQRGQVRERNRLLKEINQQLMQ